MEILATLKARLRQSIDAHPNLTATSLGLAIGKSRGYIPGLLKGDSLPSISVLAEISSCLGHTPNYFLGFDSEMRVEQTSEKSDYLSHQAERVVNQLLTAAMNRLCLEDNSPSIEDVIFWWRQGDGALGNMDAFSDKFDLFYIPDPNDQTLVPHKVGGDSLAANCLHTTSPEKLSHFLDTLDVSGRRELVKSYYEARHKISLTDHVVTVDMPGIPKAFDLAYFKLMLPVSDAAGHKYILNYSKKMPYTQ